MLKTDIFIPANIADIKKEKEKARQLKKTSWWHNKLQKKTCYYCEKIFCIENLTMDHLVPLIRGGRSIKNNLVVACKKCNSSKKYKTLVEIRLSR